MQITKLFTSFFESEKAGGLVLVICTAVSLFLANSSWSESYIHLWHTPIGNQPAEYWINDGLMAIFFLLIGLELEREVYIGELSKIKDAALPLAGALGGMLIPALLFTFFNHNTSTHKGYGIPMATDIAFAIGILSLLGNRVPPALKVFLTALAVIDDLGAIIMIALFYTDDINLINLAISLGFVGSQGVIGYTGSQGDVGYTGSVGFTGSQGSVGFTGSQGATGFTGSIGFTGSQGSIGFTGSQGVVGFTGSLGFSKYNRLS